MKLREKIQIPPDNDEDYFDFTARDSFELDGETYEYVTEYSSRTSDGEDHNFVFKRKSDNKLFRLFWWYHHSSGYYIIEERELVEVEEIIIKGYGWNNIIGK